jgi:peptide/nickel transport system permease protein
VRSWTLSLRERPFVESGRVVGLSDITLLFKYILPQMAPYLMYTFVTAIPGAVLFEAGLSILGLGDPFQPSWGKMINESLFQGGVIQGAWWWVLPPILGLILLSLGFVFIGFTLDEILNPRLRRR